MLAKAGVLPELRVHFVMQDIWSQDFEKGREYTFVFKTFFTYGIASGAMVFISNLDKVLIKKLFPTMNI